MDHGPGRMIKWRISPWIRLIIEAGVALILVASGSTISIFIESPWIRVPITILWVVGIINAFNMLDNMDGLCGGVSVIISMFFTIVALETGHCFVAAFLCCVTGAIGGFLLFNFPPARIFMGDSGSTTIGYLLAVMTLEFTFYPAENALLPDRHAADDVRGAAVRHDHGSLDSVARAPESVQGGHEPFLAPARGAGNVAPPGGADDLPDYLSATYIRNDLKKGSRR